MVYSKHLREFNLGPPYNVIHWTTPHLKSIEIPSAVWCIKLIFHWKLGLRWAPNANEIYTKNMKCTWPTQKFCVWYPTQPIFHWLALGFCVRANANFKFCVRGDADLRVCVGSKIPRCWFTQRQILASGALTNANPRRLVFCVAVEYRL